MIRQRQAGTNIKSNSKSRSQLGQRHVEDDDEEDLGDGGGNKMFFCSCHVFRWMPATTTTTKGQPITRKIVICFLLLLVFLAAIILIMTNTKKEDEGEWKWGMDKSTPAAATRTPSGGMVASSRMLSMQEMKQRFANCSHHHPKTNNEHDADSKETNDYNKTTKTLWVASFPDSLQDESILKQWVQGLIEMPPQLRAPVKAYYLQKGKTLKRCRSTTSVTVLCTVVHPFVPMNPPPESIQFTSYFDPATVYIIRNPLSVLPAHHHAKAVKYHKLPSDQQVSIQEWRHFRDQYLKGTMESWKNQVRTWITTTATRTSTSSPSTTSTTQEQKRQQSSKSSSYYHTALLVPFESIRHPQLGPQLLEQLQQVLREAGYRVVGSSSSSSVSLKNTADAAISTVRSPSQEKRRTTTLSSSPATPWLECLWYNSVMTTTATGMSGTKPKQQHTAGDNNAGHNANDSNNTAWYRNHFYDFAVEYMPPYQRPQIDWMIQQLQDFVPEFSRIMNEPSSSLPSQPKEMLVDILHQYIQELKEYPYLEKIWVLLVREEAEQRGCVNKTYLCSFFSPLDGR